MSLMTGEYKPFCLNLYSTVPQEVGSDSVSTISGGCIASGEELYQAFLRRGVTPSGNFLF